jgi:hypothetical protein
VMRLVWENEASGTRHGGNLRVQEGDTMK